MTSRSVPVFAVFATTSLSLPIAVACGPSSASDAPEKVEIAVADATEALTAKPSDKLFKLTLTKASKSYALADISVDVGLPGETRTAVNFTLEDANGDGKLDPGESLLCTEPPVNLWDPTTTKPATVSFAERRDGTLFQVGQASWTPN